MIAQGDATTERVGGSFVRTKAFAAAAFLTLFLGVARFAGADDEGGKLTFEADSECGTQAELVRRIDARSHQNERPFSERSRGYTFRVRIRKHGSLFIGDVDTRTKGAHAARVLKGQTCDEVVSGASLLIALTLDPNADTSEHPEASDPGADASDAGSADAAPSIDASVRDAETDAPKPGELPASAASWGAFVGLEPQAEFGTLPQAGLGLALAVGLERRSDEVLSPLFALLPSVTTSDLSSNSAGSYVRGALRVEACPVRLGLGGPVSIRPCAWLGGGFLRAEGSSAPIPRVATIGWFDAGVRAHVRFEWTRIFFDISGGFVVPMTRPTYVLELPKVVVYETAPAGGLLALGVGVRFL